MKRVTALAVTSLVMGLFLIPAPAVSAPRVIAVNCDSPNSSVQDAVDFASGPTTIRFSGWCDEVVTIAKDDITLDGQDVGTVSGTINFDGAHRGVLKNTTVTGPGVGVAVFNGATAKLRDNIIDANVSYGVTISDGAFARLTNNTVTDNGRAAPHFEAGISVSRAMVVGQGNVISNNRTTGVEVYNLSSYRTGSFLTPLQPDNEGPFETISVGEDGNLAVDIGQTSFIDLRQVLITGDAWVGRKSMLQIRGDDKSPGLSCSQIDGNLTATATLAQVRLTFTHVTDGNTIDGAYIDGGSTDIGDCLNLL